MTIGSHQRTIGKSQVRNGFSVGERRRHEAAFIRFYRIEALRAQGGRCCYCAEPLSHRQSTADHVVPRLLGGTSTRANIRAACKPCNLAKGALSVEVFEAVLFAQGLRRGMPLRLIRAWARAHIWRRQLQAEQRIRAAAGLPA